MKKWWQSKTIWIAALQAVAGILIAVLNENPALQSVGVIALMKSLVDISLRLVTEKEIK